MQNVYLRSVYEIQMHSRLSRCSIARGSSTKFSWVSPTKAEAPKSFLFTESSPVWKNKEHLVDLYFHTFLNMKNMVFGLSDASETKQVVVWYPNSLTVQNPDFLLEFWVPFTI